ncbi:hypothetical protein Pelo_7815 [Pelomyxa schiedti]|nr:hypothetical protein Pelo_7815 [Pelomyxa schiedti]
MSDCNAWNTGGPQTSTPARRYIGPLPPGASRAELDHLASLSAVQLRQLQNEVEGDIRALAARRETRLDLQATDEEIRRVTEEGEQARQLAASLREQCRAETDKRSRRASAISLIEGALPKVQKEVAYIMQLIGAAMKKQRGVYEDCLIAVARGVAKPKTHERPVDQPFISWTHLTGVPFLEKIQSALSPSTSINTARAPHFFGQCEALGRQHFRIFVAFYGYSWPCEHALQGSIGIPGLGNFMALLRFSISPVVELYVKIPGLKAQIALKISSSLSGNKTEERKDLLLDTYQSVFSPLKKPKSNTYYTRHYVWFWIEVN